MKAALATRLLRLETYQKATQELAPKVVFGELALLPRSYAGERHIVRISEASDGDFDRYEERTGPGPALEGEPGTLLVMFVPSPLHADAE
jgi:hypothetical protein